jgi:hypothetical protein
MSETTNLALPLIAAAQAQKHVTHNEALLVVDALLNCAVLDKDLAAPPGAPSDGQRWIVGPAPTGAWAGKEGQIAAWQDGVWRFYPPRAGFLAFVVDEPGLYYHDGAAWQPGSGATVLQNLALLGIGTTADATNPFAAKLNKALWTAKTVAEGGDGDLRYTLNKESAAKTLSLLFQSAFSGRAEIGLTGDDDLHVKVSADGAAWVEALRIASATGRVSIPKLRPAGLFHVTRNGAAQTGWAGTGYQKIAFTAKEADPDGWFDAATNHRFQPQEPGRYAVFLGTYMVMASAAAAAPACQIARNGAAFANGAAIDFASAVVSAGGSGCSALVPLNGTTDHVEFRIYVGDTGNTLFGAKHLTYAMGLKVSDL